MKKRIADSLLLLAAFYILLPVLIAATFGPRWAGFYRTLSEPPPPLTQWAIKAYPYTFGFVFALVPVYLLTRLKEDENILRVSLIVTVLLLMLALTVWSFLVGFGLYLPIHVMREVTGV